jgi:uncharacterized membrane protein YjjP (DUF1212 family)
MAQASWIPSRKWLATQVTAVAAFVVAWVNQGAWDKTLSIALIGLLSQAIFSYLVPNADRSSVTDGQVTSTPASAGVAAP